MFGLRLSSPRLHALTSRQSLPRLVESALFVVAIWMLAATTWGNLRSTGPASLAILTLIAALSGMIDRGTAIRRLAVLALAFVAAYWVRNHTESLIAHRVGRFTLLGGLGVTALLSVPSAVVIWLRRMQSRLNDLPNLRSGFAVAVFAVAVPSACLYWNTTIHVWTGDTMPVVPTVVQIVTTGSRELTPVVDRAAPGAADYDPRNVEPADLDRWKLTSKTGWPYFVREVQGRPGLYSTYPAGMEVFALPVVLGASALGYDVHNDYVQLKLEKLTASILTGCSLALFFLIALHFGSLSGAFATTWLMATGSVFSTTLGMLLWQQGGIVFWMLLALAVEVRAAGRPGWTGLLLQALACGWILACRPSAVTFLVPFGLWVMARDRRRGLLLPALAILCYLPWGLMYWSIYRTPFGPSMGFLNETWSPGQFVLDVLVSPGRGLFVFQPWLLLLLLRISPAVRTGEKTLPGWSLFALGMVSLHVLLIASWPCWWGGSCYGSRLIAEVVPIVALFVVRPASWLLARREGWIPLAAIGLVGFAVHVPCLYYDGWLWNGLPISADANPWRLWDWGPPAVPSRAGQQPVTGTRHGPRQAEAAGVQTARTRGRPPTGRLLRAVGREETQFHAGRQAVLFLSLSRPEPHG